MARALFIKYMQKAGLSHKGYTLHCLRHTFASELLNAGMRLECRYAENFPDANTKNLVDAHAGDNWADAK